MKKLLIALGVASLAHAANAESMLDQVTDVGKYIDEKAKDTSDFIDQNTDMGPSSNPGSVSHNGQPGSVGPDIDTSGILPDSDPSSGTKAAPGQVGTPVDTSVVVPDAAMQDQDQGPQGGQGQDSAKGTTGSTKPGTIVVPGLATDNN